jgi:hypothetical protein
LNTYPNEWELLTECPKFLLENKKFGSIYIFDNSLKPICKGWTLIHTFKDSIQFENLGYDSKRKEELNDLKLYIETFFESDLKLESNPSLVIEQNFFIVKVSTELVQKILLQMTRPNAFTCKYSLSEKMKFSGYWNYARPYPEKEEFELTFQYSSKGNFIYLPNDPHMMHQYGEVVPLAPNTYSWLKEYVKELPISPTVETDPCSFQIFKLSDFLYVTDLFREKSI